MSTERLYLLDGNAFAYRAHFAFSKNRLINSKGLDTSPIFGFAGALLQLLETESPEHMAIVFDAPGRTFRDDIFEEYKGHRPPMPDELKIAMPHIKNLVRNFDIPLLEIEGYEADDVIGTLARRAEEEGVHAIIVSPDKDFRQLISPLISILRPAYRGESFDIFDLDAFREKYGVEPIQFIDILALMGDKADNVPGVMGIGEKGAIKLLQEHGTVEKLIEIAGDIKGKRAREGLQNHADDAMMSKKLVTIHTEVECDVDWHKLRVSRPDLAVLDKMFAEFEFRSHRDRAFRIFGTPDKPDLFNGGDLFSGDDDLFSAGGSAYDTYDEDEVDYQLLQTVEKMQNEAAKMASSPQFAFDTETTSVDPVWASLVGCSFSNKGKEASYIPTPARKMSTEEVLEALKPALEDSETLKIGQNVKYDYVVLAQHGIKVKGPFFDTMIADYLLDPDNEHNMDALAKRHLQYEPISITELIGKGKNQLSMRDIAVDEVTIYACEDADITFQLAEVLREELETQELLELAEKIEFPLIPVLGDMECTGVRIDAEVLAEISKKLGKEVDRLRIEIYEAAGREFNVNSPKQLGEILFDEIGLKVIRKTPSGKPSTNERVLRELATEHDLPAFILDYRKLFKLKNTYVDTLPALIHPETGRVHTSFNQARAATGRLSSESPNLQNIPIRSAAGREIRRAFIPRDGWLMFSADYAQIELRIIASLSGDPDLKAAFEEGLDIHTATAAKIYDLDPEEVTREMRSKAKEVNYGIPYGISAFGLSERLRIPRKEAQSLIDQYFVAYPGIKTWIDSMLNDARQQGFVESLAGRRRHLPNINASNRNLRLASERMAINMPVQGSQADMIKLAMIDIDQRIKDQKLETKMILQVHDELVFEVPPAELETVKALVEDAMINAMPLDVPIEVGAGVGNNWLEAH